jgi:DhnA family fructose-bisphosphate aldolase class Ia
LVEHPRSIDGLAKLVKKNRSLLVAFDHGIVFGSLPGSEKPGWVLEQIIEGKADGVLVTPGLARRFANVLKGRIGVILSIPTDPAYVEYAARLGADGVKTTFFGDVTDSEVTKMQEDVAMACQSQGMVYLDEVVPADAGSYKAKSDPALVRLAVRRAAELGADMVKTAYTGDRASFERAVASTFIPVVILGGEKSGDREVLQMTRDAVDAGGAGIAYGRNIWGRDDPRAMIEALRMIIHEGRAVDEALELLK